jgi:dihydrofolate synthase / folylpolyglutamate synthase
MQTPGCRSLGITRHTSVSVPGTGHDPNGHVRWLQSLTPWPAEFGLARMHTLLADLGEPQRRYRSIHVVGTNGKSSTTLLTGELLRSAGLHVGAYISPHVRGWSERIQIDGVHADLDAALARIRPYAEGATQFEVLTAAALAEFAAQEVDVAVLEAGLGGRHDATNVVQAPIVVLTNIALDHTEVLGETREAIAAEKLAVVTPGAVVILGEPEWEELARENGAARVELPGNSNLALAVAAAEAQLGRTVDPHAADALAIPGRLERRGDTPLEIWDGAHNLAGVGYLLPRLPARDYVLLCSILRDKRPELMLEALSVLGGTLVATESANARSLQAGDLASRAEPYFRHVEPFPDPQAARRRALELAGREGALVVTGSLYLLAELSGHGYNQ